MGSKQFQKLVFARFSEDDLPAEVWTRVEEHAEAVVRVADDESPALRSELADADALIVKLGRPVTSDMISSAPALRYIGVYGTGYADVDVAAATERNIAVCNVADYSTQGVAEFTVATILAELRELHRAFLQAREGDFSEATYTGVDLASLQVGIVGAGAIGTRTATLIHEGFGTKTFYWSRNHKSSLEQAGISYQELDELLASSDIVSVHILSNDDTHEFFDSGRLGKIKSGALIVSTVPMTVFALPALMDGLRRKKFRLIFDHPDEMAHQEAVALGALPGVVTYPPIAYTTLQSSRAKYDRFVASIAGYLSGSPVNQVN
jgi:D-3-phosphoglycerate dehydrogenase